MNRKLLIIAALIFSTAYIFPQKVGDAYRFNINNLNIPINRVGTIADVNIPPEGAGGRFGNGTFLFSSGFMVSGYTNDTLWACAQATSSLIENFLPGKSVPITGDDPQIYVLSRLDEPFGQSWQDWIDAVALGADFYDGDGDGIYNPIDLNGNNQWDANEDAPDILGDKTAWCLFNDGQPADQRVRFAGIAPQGIEIRQTMFAYASTSDEGNIIFLRYRISNSGLLSESLDSVIFSVWADPDLGEEFDDDLVGVDVQRNAGFTYNGDDNDPVYGSQIPSFIIDFLSGPVAYIPGETFIDNNGDGIFTENVDTPLDTAYTFRGQRLGIKEFPGAKNLDNSSFVHYISSDPIRGDPNDQFEARNYGSGRLKLGQLLDPCNDPLGEVLDAVDCSTVDPLFWYSGDPVTNGGWLNNSPSDQRQMTNVGPFTLTIGEEIEILVAYVVGQGSDRLNSITVARNISDIAQSIYDINFDFPVGIKEDNPDQIPTNFYLFQNFPNPFNPTTTIRFTISDLRFTILKVYDVLGNEITTLVDEELPAGSYEVEFSAKGGSASGGDASSLPSGVYFYQLKAGNHIEAKKMLILK